MQTPAPAQSLHVDETILRILSETGNKCLEEVGYYPSLRSDHENLQKQYKALYADNAKFYSDNHTLAQFMKTQEHKCNALVAENNELRKAYDAV